MRVVGEIFRYKLELLCYDKCGSAKPQIKAQEVQIMDVNSLAHTKWECKYHIVLPIVISITQGFTSIPKAKS